MFMLYCYLAVTYNRKIHWTSRQENTSISGLIVTSLDMEIWSLVSYLSRISTKWHSSFLSQHDNSIPVHLFHYSMYTIVVTLCVISASCHSNCMCQSYNNTGSFFISVCFFRVFFKRILIAFRLLKSMSLCLVLPFPYTSLFLHLFLYICVHLYLLNSFSVKAACVKCEWAISEVIITSPSPL